MYTGLSRATTMGKNNVHESAIFFTGPNITPHQLKNMTKITNKNQKTVKIRRRDAWITHLHRGIKHSLFGKSEINEIYTWATTTTYTKNNREEMINKPPNSYQLN